MAQFFEVTDLGAGIFCLKDLSTVQMYLVEGRDRAALLDTGTGIGDLAAQVRTLTDKPVSVYLTHGHVDHAGGIYSFEQIHLSQADVPLLQENTRPERRKAFADFVGQVTGIHPWSEADFAAVRPIGIRTVSPGEEIDLGGRTLTVVNMAGHTRGSVGYFDSATATLFAGDGCNNSTFLFLPESTPVAEYRRTLLDLKARWGGRMQRMMICHDYTSVPLDCIDNVLACCDSILAGTDAREPFVFAFEPMKCRDSVWAAPGGATRKDGKFGNVTYDRSRELELWR